jgi:heterodisulfide reductase subunit C
MSRYSAKRDSVKDTPQDLPVHWVRDKPQRRCQGRKQVRMAGVQPTMREVSSGTGLINWEVEMNKRMRDYDRMLGRIGCRIVSIDKNGKHYKVHLLLPNGKQFINVISVSPSDAYWVDANRQLIQRVIRENHQQA